MRGSVVLVALVVAAAPAFAQSPPYSYPRTVGTASVQVLPANNTRKRVVFVNPNATAIVSVCPVTSRVNSGTVTCTLNGAGSIPLLPYASIQFDGLGGPPGPVAPIPTAWNAIADTPESALSVYEWE
jgi:hypothetical protein